MKGLGRGQGTRIYLLLAQLDPLLESIRWGVLPSLEPASDTEQISPGQQARSPLPGSS